jgi:carboxyl-terminal processing protease
MNMGVVWFCRRSKLPVVIGLFLFVALLHAQSSATDSRVKSEVLDKIASIIKDKAFVPGIDFSKWPDFLKEEKADLDDAKTDDEFQHAVNTALHKFGASHVLLMTPRVAQSRKTGSTVGIGISTQVAPEGLAVLRVVKDGPADKAGIVPGDMIVEVDGKPISGLRGLSGEIGSEVAIKVKHESGKSEDYKITRQRYSTTRSPELSWIDKDTAILKVYSFEAGYDRPLIASLITQAQNAKNLIIDLRYNGGGAVSNLQHLLGMLIPEDKPLGAFIKKSTVTEYVAKTGGKPIDLAAIEQWTDNKFYGFHREDSPFFTGRVAVLVNKFSGSASEIAAAALHDLIGAPIIGTKSAGAVLASIIVPATNGFMLQFPIEDYVTIKGVRLEGTGVSPDFEVPDSIVAPHDTKDTAIDKAAEYFAGFGARSEL